jgi:hypothetical protein
MDRRKLAEGAKPTRMLTFVSKLRAPHHQHTGKDGTIDAVRHAEHRGHHIVVHTIYKIEVDGRVLQVPLTLANDGRLHCHSLPHYEFSSAIDMVERLIDAFKEDFPFHPTAQQ